MIWVDSLCETAYSILNCQQKTSVNDPWMNDEVHDVKYHYLPLFYGFHFACLPLMIKSRVDFLPAFNWDVGEVKELRWGKSAFDVRRFSSLTPQYYTYKLKKQCT